MATVVVSGTSYESGTPSGLGSQFDSLLVQIANESDAARRQQLMQQAELIKSKSYGGKAGGGGSGATG